MGSSERQSSQRLGHHATATVEGGLWKQQLVLPCSPWGWLIDTEHWEGGLMSLHKGLQLTTGRGRGVCRGAGQLLLRKKWMGAEVSTC